jgi:hypothetical protein
MALSEYSPSSSDVNGRNGGGSGNLLSVEALKRVRTLLREIEEQARRGRSSRYGGGRSSRSRMPLRAAAVRIGVGVRGAGLMQSGPKLSKPCAFALLVLRRASRANNSRVVIGM